MALADAKKPCPLFGERLGTEEVTLFPPLVSNEVDPLYVFNDAAVHSRCLAVHALGQAALMAREAFHDRSDRCIVCGEALGQPPGDPFTTGMLTSDEASPVFQFNFVGLHRAHFVSWARACEFRDVLGAAVASPAWQGAQLEFDPAPSWRNQEGASQRRRQVVFVSRPEEEKH
jgi:hypothetical protein